MESKIREFVPGQVSFTTSNRTIPSCSRYISLSVDIYLEYLPVGREFGPFDLYSAVLFFQTLQRLLAEARSQHKLVLAYCNCALEHKTNTLLLLSLFRVICRNESPGLVYQTVQEFKPYYGYCDTHRSAREVPFQSFVFGAYYLVKRSEFQFQDVDFQFFEYYKQRQNGQITQVLPHRLEMFSSPISKIYDMELEGLPAHYFLDIFKLEKVEVVVRTCHDYYSFSLFRENHISCFDLPFEEDAAPTVELANQFFQICEKYHGLIAIHSEDSWGAVGTLICCYLMRYLQIPALQAIAITRLYRSGSVVGVQQAWLEANEMFLENKEPPQHESISRLELGLTAPVVYASPCETNRMANEFVNSPLRKLQSIERMRTPLQQRPQSTEQGQSYPSVVIRSGRLIEQSYDKKEVPGSIQEIRKQRSIRSRSKVITFNNSFRSVSEVFM